MRVNKKTELGPKKDPTLEEKLRYDQENQRRLHRGGNV